MTHLPTWKEEEEEAHPPLLPPRPVVATGAEAEEAEAEGTARARQTDEEQQ